MTEEFKRKLTAILSADVAGYSRLMDDDEEATIRTLKDYRSLIAETVEKHRGRVVDSPGDNVMAAFESVVDSVKCAVEIQKSLFDRNSELTDDRKMQFRIGINLGDVVEEDDRIYGDGVNIAARVESFADAGGICISGRVYEQVENKIDVEYEFLGEKTAKNIRKPIRVYKIPIEFDAEEKDEESILDSIIDMSVPTDKPSIAVLPFVNMSDDSEQEYFSDGMTEEIITALSKIPDMLVIARNSTFVYKGKAVDVKQVGRELGVRYVLEGSVRKAGNRIRVIAQLIDAETGNHIWADRYDRELKDIFDLQDELTLGILSELGIRLYHDIPTKLKIKGTDNLDAYLKWWQGIEYLNRLTKADNSQAYECFLEVVKLDPNWGQGYAFLGAVKTIDYFNGWSSSPEHCLNEAIEYSKKAISLDHTIPHSYATLCTSNLFNRRYDEAVANAEKAIAMQPNYHVGYQMLGYVLIYYGKPKKAQEILKKAIRLGPKQPLVKCYLGVSYCDSGQYAESIALLKKSIQDFPDLIRLHVYLTAAYIFSGMKEEARKQAKEILRIDPKFTVDNYANRLFYKNQSDTDRILNALRKAGLK